MISQWSDMTTPHGPGWLVCKPFEAAGAMADQLLDAASGILTTQSRAEIKKLTLNQNLMMSYQYCVKMTVRKTYSCTRIGESAPDTWLLRGRPGGAPAEAQATEWSMTLDRHCQAESCGGRGDQRGLLLTPLVTAARPPSASPPRPQQ